MTWHQIRTNYESGNKIDEAATKETVYQALKYIGVEYPMSIIEQGGELYGTHNTCVVWQKRIRGDYLLIMCHESEGYFMQKLLAGQI
jgi:hypothetical protein